MSGPTRVANQARLVRCSAGCGTMVWLQGALPTTSDDSVVCSACATWRCLVTTCGWTGPDRSAALDHERLDHEGAAVCMPIDEELDSYLAARAEGSA